MARAACYTVQSQFPVCFLHTSSCRCDWQKAVNQSVFSVSILTEEEEEKGGEDKVEEVKEVEDGGDEEKGG